MYQCVFNTTSTHSHSEIPNSGVQGPHWCLSLSEEQVRLCSFQRVGDQRYGVQRYIVKCGIMAGNATASFLIVLNCGFST